MFLSVAWPATVQVVPELLGVMELVSEAGARGSLGCAFHRPSVDAGREWRSDQEWTSLAGFRAQLPMLSQKKETQRSSISSCLCRTSVSAAQIGMPPCALDCSPCTSLHRPRQSRHGRPVLASPRAAPPWIFPTILASRRAAIPWIFLTSRQQNKRKHNGLLPSFSSPPVPPPYLVRRLQTAKVRRKIVALQRSWKKKR